MSDAELSALLKPWLMVWVACLGGCVGSFLNVVVFRLPRRCLSVFRPARSFCPKCHHAIRWYENLPVVSWAFVLRARCAGCGLPISARYPLVEAGTILIFLAAAWTHLDGRWLIPAAWGAFLVHACFLSALLCCALIDWDLRVIPDLIDLPGIALGPLALALVPALLGSRLPDLQGGAAGATLWLESSFAWWGIGGALTPLEGLAGWLGQLPQAPYQALQGLWAGLLGAAVGGGGTWLIAGICSRALGGREALGFGDIKLTAMIGAFTGWEGVLVTLLIASLLGTGAGLVKMAGASARREPGGWSSSALPFGPFLAVGGASVALTGEGLLRLLAP